MANQAVRSVLWSSRRLLLANISILLLCHGLDVSILGAETDVNSKKRRNTLPFFSHRTPHFGIYWYNWLIYEISKKNSTFFAIAHRFKEMTKNVSMGVISAAKVTRNFVNCRMFNYGPPKDLLSNNDGYFTSKLFIDVFRIISIQKKLTATYQSQHIYLFQRFNRTLLEAPHTCVASHPRDP